MYQVKADRAAMFSVSCIKTLELLKIIYCLLCGDGVAANMSSQGF